MDSKDYYAILGVSRDADAETIKRSYRRLALQYHPDRNPGDKEAEERFKEISEAYEVLSDPEKRRQYDLFGQVGPTGASAADPFTQVMEEVFEQFFGGRTRRRRPTATPGEDIQLTLELTLEEIAQGTRRTLTYARKEACSACAGTGSASRRPPAPCPTCGGTGQVAYRVGGGFFQQIVHQTCPDCKGTGVKILDLCPVCGGSGLELTTHTQEVEIPPGAAEDMILSLRGAGHRGPLGGPPGDLLLQIVEKPHPTFVREGENLIYETWVSYPDLILGTTLEIPTLIGEPVPLRIEPGTPSGEVFRLTGKGLSRYGSRKKGDLLVQVHVWIPSKLSRSDKELLNTMRKSPTFQPAQKRPERSFLQKLRAFFGKT